MKVYSLYHNETYVASFPNKEDAIFYGKQFYEDGWTCNIVEEYLNKTPYQMYTSPLTSLTPQQTIPCNPGVTLIPGTPQINNSVRAEPYKDVRAYWEEK